MEWATNWLDRIQGFLFYKEGEFLGDICWGGGGVNLLLPANLDCFSDVLQVLLQQLWQP